MAEGAVKPQVPWRIDVCTRDPKVLAHFPGATKVCVTPMAGGILSQRARGGRYQIPFDVMGWKNLGPIEVFSEIIVGINLIHFVTVAESNTVTVTVT